MKHVFQLRSNTYEVMTMRCSIEQRYSWKRCDTRENMSLHNFLLFHFLTCQKLGLRASPRIPNTSKQMNAVSVSRCLAPVMKHSPSLLTLFKWNWRRIQATHSKKRGIVWSTWSWIFVSYSVKITFFEGGKPSFLVSFWRLCGSLMHCNF